MYNFDSYPFMDLSDLQELPKWDAPIKSLDVPNTTQNSPASFKSQSMEMEDTPNDTSFEVDIQKSHAESIWASSVQFITDCVSGFISEAKGFNEENIYKFHSSEPSEKELELLLKKNQNFKVKERTKFIKDIRKETEIMQLLKELVKLFNEEVFHEIAYVVYKVWEKNYLPFRSKKVSQPIIPRFNCFIGFEEDEKELPCISYFEEKDAEAVVAASQQNIEAIAEEIYFHKKIKCLNLKEVNKKTKDSTKCFKQFTRMIANISQAVFLSAECLSAGCTNLILENQSVLECEEMADVVEISPKEVRGNIRSRTFSQLYESNEDVLSSVATKKRKM